MDHIGIYIWLWIIIANAGAFVAMTSMGGSTSAMGLRERSMADAGMHNGMRGMGTSETAMRDTAVRTPAPREPGSPRPPV